MYWYIELWMFIWKNSNAVQKYFDFNPKAGKGTFSDRSVRGPILTIQVGGPLAQYLDTCLNRKKGFVLSYYGL